MAFKLKRNHRLPTLVLANNQEGTVSPRRRVTFRLEVGDDIIDQMMVPTAMLNIPADLRELQAYEYKDPDYIIPPHITAWIRERLPRILSRGAPLWLLFGSSAGFLPLVPWERLLQAELNVPILRVPNFLLNPLADHKVLDVVLCASSPMTEPLIPLEQVLLQIIRPLLRRLQSRVRINVFTDGQAYHQLQAMVATEGLAMQVRVHDPWNMPTGKATSSIAMRNPDVPWLDWITSTLNGRSIDLAYFIAHGCLSATDGLLMVAESPTRNRNREVFIGAHQIDRFLSTTGAWSVGFTAPPHNYSGSGLRLLVEQVAQLRPGPVLLHDFALDPDCFDLRETFNFLFDSTGMAPASRAISLYSHPEYVRSEIRGGYNLSPTKEKTEHLTLAGNKTVSELLQSKDTAPSWLLNSQRVLERTAAELDRTEMIEDYPSATREGSESALRFAADVLAEFAIAQQSEHPSDQEQ